MTARQLRDICQRLGIWISRYPLPGARGMSAKTPTGYAIVICDTLSPEAQHRAIMHELAHITLHHYDSREWLSLVEKEAEVARLLSLQERERE